MWDGRTGGGGGYDVGVDEGRSSLKVERVRRSVIVKAGAACSQS